MPPQLLTLALEVRAETWPLRAAFVISRGARTAAEVVTVTLADGRTQGRGECVPYARYGETVEGVIGAIRNAGPITDRAALQSALPAGAARNALDCALWDLEAKRTNVHVSLLLGEAAPRALETCLTLSLARPEDMAAAARAAAQYKVLKLKLGGGGDPERMGAVRRARPDARLVADANEAWTVGQLAPFLAAAAAAGVELIEQPLPAGNDAALAALPHPVAVCADESVHTRTDLAPLRDRYDAVNIKLDKAGGLTEALAMSAAARELGFRIMAGSMVATSLAVAPAFVLAQGADWVDLDGPLLLAADRPHGLVVRGGIIEPPPAALWG